MANEQNLIPFKKGSDKRRNLKGRPKKLLTEVLELFSESGYQIPTATQIRDCYLCLIVLPEHELKGIVQDKEQPMLMRISAQNILSKKGFETIEKMFDRAIGKPTQKTEITGEDGTAVKVEYDLSKLSVNELKQLREISTKLEKD